MVLYLPLLFGWGRQPWPGQGHSGHLLCLTGDPQLVTRAASTTFSYLVMSWEFVQRSLLFTVLRGSAGRWAPLEVPGWYLTGMAVGLRHLSVQEWSSQHRTEVLPSLTIQGPWDRSGRFQDGTSPGVRDHPGQLQSREGIGLCLKPTA
jgi:hypothetical protein